MRSLVIVFLGVAAFAVDAKAPELSEIQKMRLQLDQKDAIIAQNNLQAAQANFQNAINKFGADCETIKKDAHFPEKSQCDITSAGITLPAPEPAKPEPPKPEPVKK